MNLIRDILFRPVSYFSRLGESTPDFKQFLNSYGLPLMVLGAAGRMARVLVEQALQGVVLRGDQLAVVFLINLVAFFISMWVGSLLISRLAPSFKSGGKPHTIMVLIMVSYTPFMLSQPLAAISPNMSPISMLGLFYTVYLFWAGCRPMLGTPDHKRVGFTLAGFFIILGIAAISIVLLSNLFIRV